MESRPPCEGKLKDAVGLKGQDALHDLRARLAAVPRVSLGQFPTPLTECQRLAKHLGGPRIFMKREDLSGLALGGNKARLLEFRLAEALRLGADVVIAGLGEQSNSARQLTAAANRLGLQTVLLLRSGREPVWQGNLLLDHILGAEIRFLTPAETDIDAALRAAAAQERERGHTPYVMNHARFFAVGAALAGLEWTVEAIEQLAQGNAWPTHWYLSSGGKCQAGMALAQRYLDQAFRVVGVAANPEVDAVAATCRIASETAALLGLEVRLALADVDNRGGYAGAEAASATADSVEAVKLVARLEGILLDPVFTGKAMAALIADIESGHLDSNDTVVFVHTGGVPALFTHAGAFTPRRLPGGRPGPPATRQGNPNE